MAPHHPATTGPTILDGGLATHLQSLGHDLTDDLWSARLLLHDPAAITAAHRDFFHAGAHLATTATYQASLPALHRRGLDTPQARRLLRSAVDLAARARDDTGARLVAASIGPYGAALADGSEYTGDYGLDTPALTRWHQERWHLLADTPADLLACETIPSHPETLALARLMARTPATPAWVSFSCRDDAHLADGTPVEAAAAAVLDLPNLAALGANCTAPRHIPGLLSRLSAVAGDTPLLAYPNSGESWNPRTRTWSGAADPEDFAEAAGEWHAGGAALLGGCCRTGPAHIRALAARLTQS